MRHKAVRTGIVLFSFAVIISFILISVTHISSFARTYDEVDFALSLERYDLLAMQPHFPGYPYYILGAMVVHSWVSDPIEALSVFNMLMALSSIIPMVLLVRRYSDMNKGMLFAVLILTSPSLWLMSTQPMSEGAGIAVLWWYSWSVRGALEHSSSKLWQVLPLFMFGILMGIRLSYFPFGLAIVLLWVTQFKKSESARADRWKSLLNKLVIAVCCQLIWVGGLVWSEGGPLGFLQLSVAFVKGHFLEWGGGVSSSSMPLGTRVFQFLTHNLLWSAGLGQSILIGILLSLWIIILVIGIRLYPISKLKLLASRFPFFIWLLSCVGLYTLWALFGQNIEKPRHITPIIGFLLMFMYILAIRAIQKSKNSGRMVLPTLTYLILFSLILTQLNYGALIMKRQANEVPSTYQLHHYLNDREEPFIIYTWEESRVLQYVQADYTYKEIFTFNLFKAEVAANPNQPVLLTDHVLQGFEQQVGSLRDHVKLVGTFESDSLFDPTYHDIAIYEWISNP